MRYLCVGLHQETTESGLTLYYGDEIDLDSPEGHDKTLVDEGVLIPAEDQPAPASPPAAPAKPATDTTAASSQSSTSDSKEASA